MHKIYLFLLGIILLNYCQGQENNPIKKCVLFSKNETLITKSAIQPVTDPVYKIFGDNRTKEAQAVKVDFDCTVLPANAIIDSISLRIFFNNTGKKDFSLFTGCLNKNILEKYKNYFS